MNILTGLIQDFSVDKLEHFFRHKLHTFKLEKENYEYLFEDKKEITENFGDIVKIGQAELENVDDVIAIAARSHTQLTTRTGKKRQYDIAKKILKEENKDAAFSVFYDDEGNFRFSFIRVNFLGTRRDYTDFKRYTYFVSREFTNKTFITQLSKADFNDLESVLEAFNVEPLTKQFYEKLQHWYFWALDNVKFPFDAEAEPNGREMAVIRLITRLMFIWFMKVRKLIPLGLFDEENIKNLLKDVSFEESTYYKAILQNLFFATLNTRQAERKFRSVKRGNKGYNPDFGNHNVYRYQALFENAGSLEKLFSEIPFLNGGLFECLDYKSKEKEERKYIDGFTDIKEQQPRVPNFLFFTEPRKADISKYFGKKDKTYEVQGLIYLLNSYNFTIDENEPDDIEVALDPELLGSIFENLLASYNPETATTARKATGSFYTPREIVNYMTNESLKEYFRTHLEDQQIDTLDGKIDDLMAPAVTTNPFDEATTKKIIQLIDGLRIVDPAVGSGAFPMTILNKLVFILGKLDPENRFWKQSQIDGIKKAVSDPMLQKRLMEDVEQRFREKNADYGRKLYLIEKCIYGVDIQQIAVEIAKLRFFISLLVDEKVDFDRPDNNYGIEPLPNLEFKIMQGNSLISSYAGIDFSNKEKNNENLLFDDPAPYRQLIKEFEEVKNEYQNEPEKERKNKLRGKIEKAVLRIFEEKIAQLLPELREIEEKAKLIPTKGQRAEYIRGEKEKLTKKLGFDIEEAKKDLVAYTEGRKPKDFFLWKVFFAEVFSQKGAHSTGSGQGFDIVIGNPPYGAKISKDELKIIKTKLKDTINTNSAAIFIDFAKNNLLNLTGVLSFIVPKSLLFSEKWLSLAKSLAKHTSVLVDAEVAFENVLLEQVLFVFVKSHEPKTYKALKFKNKKFSYRTNNQISLLNIFSSWICDVFENEINIAKKIKNFETINLCDISETKRGVGLQKYLSNDGEVGVIGGKEIARYRILGKKGYLQEEEILKQKKKLEFIKQPKIVSQDLIAHIQRPYPHIKIKSTIDVIGNLIGMDTVQNTIIRSDNYSKYYILGLLNSKLINWYTYKFIYCSAIRTMHLDSYYIGKIPVHQISRSGQKLFEIIVNKIISKKEHNENSTAEENEIDLMVYRLYELTYEKVKIVDPEFALSKESYDNFTM